MTNSYLSYRLENKNMGKRYERVNAFDEKHTELQDEVGFFIKRKEKVKKY